MKDFKFCGECGTKISVDSKFCPKCGQKMSEKMQEQNTENTKLEGYTAEQNTDFVLESKNLPKRIKPVLVVSIVLAFLCISGLIGGGIYYKKTSDNNKTKVATVAKVFSGQKDENIKINVNQIDNQSFPLMKLYVSVTDNEDVSIDNLPLDYFSIQEKNKNTNEYNSQKIQSVDQLETTTPLSIDLVMDTSGSMAQDSKLDNAKNAATSFINLVSDKDQLEILEFNDFVRTKTDFTNNKSTLIDGVSGLYPEGQTALYDSLYTAITQTNARDGAKCVIAFTDGMSNKDSKTQADVIDLAKKTGIPIYMIGIGNDVESQGLTDIATQTGGSYVNAPSAEQLAEIYKNIFKIQKKQYVISYTSSNTSTGDSWRDVQLAVSSDKYTGLSQREYTSQIVKPNSTLFDTAKINEIIKANADNANYSVVIKDLSNGEESMAGDYQRKMPASALINVPITLAIADMIKNDKIKLTDPVQFKFTTNGRGKFTKSDDGNYFTIDTLLQIMMNYSDNNCTNSLLDYIGIPEVNNIIRRYGFTQTELQRNLFVTDGVKENWTTCEDIGKMLELLYSDSLPIGSAYMDEHFKIVDITKKEGILKYLPDTIFALHHNGVASDKYNETAFIGTGSKKYIITVISNNGEQDKLAETTAQISKYVYDEIIK